MITITSSTYLGTILDNNRHQEKPTDATRHQQMVPGTPVCSRMRGGSCWHWMAFAGVWWCLTAAFSVLWCLEMWEGLSGVSQRVSELLLWTCLRFGFLPGSIWVFRPCLVQLALYWKIFERQNSMHLAFLKHQNTKTSLCELSKNHWVIALF